MAKTTIPASTEQPRNVAISDSIGLSMDAMRARRFSSAMARINWAVHSLEMATQMFPRYGAEPGYMEPVATALSFAKAIDAEVQLLYQMIENEEEPEQEAQS